MSELEKIQKTVRDELRGAAEFAQVAVAAEGIDALPVPKKSAYSITVKRPVPVSAAKNSGEVVFAEVLLEIGISVPKCRPQKLSALEIFERVCRRLHNKKIDLRQNCGKILLSRSVPFEFAAGNESVEKVSVKFLIQGVKI